MITQLTDSLIAVEVPKDATDLKIGDGNFPYPKGYFYFKTNENTLGVGDIKLPKGNYTILGEFSANNSASDIQKIAAFSVYTVLHAKGCILTESNKYIILKRE